MASEIWLTDGVIRVTTGTTTQPLTQAVDVSEFDQADLTLWIGGFEGTPGGGTLTVEVLTGMSNESEVGWTAVIVTPFTASATPNVAEIKNFPRLMKYIRWRASLTGTFSAATFSVRGMARNN